MTAATHGPFPRAHLDKSTRRLARRGFGNPVLEHGGA
jgi:hypothetical protein